MTDTELTKCIDAYGKEIYSFCKWLTGCGPEAEELYQDTWLVVRRLEELDAAGNVKSYCLNTLNQDGSVALGVYVPKDVSRYLG